jgi:Protein NO VEIN, C-terminal
LDKGYGEPRSIEVKGLAGSEGEIILTLSEHRVAEDRRGCYWLCVVTDCREDNPQPRRIRNPVGRSWKAVTRVALYTFSSNEL